MADKDWRLSILCLIVAGICDLFDGCVARKTKSHNRVIGKQLDSLIDVVSFGVLPAVILVSLKDDIIINFILSFAYVSCAVWRLAVFNTIPGDREYFTGIPVTFISLLLPLALIPILFLDPEIVIWTTRVLMLTVAFLFVSKLKFPKPKGGFYIGYTVTGILLIIFWSGCYLWST